MKLSDAALRWQRIPRARRGWQLVKGDQVLGAVWPKGMESKAWHGQLDSSPTRYGWETRLGCWPTKAAAMAALWEAAER